MRIMITGGNGNLARELAKILGQNHKVNALARLELDITDSDAVIQSFSSLQPDIVINTAALTDVDDCEYQLDKAFMVNGKGPLYLAEACKKYDSLLVHFSTEMIFDGIKTDPYFETDCPNPLLAYGLTKYVGEQNIKRTECRYAIFRTSWLFGGGVPKFVDTFIAKALQQDTINVVDDQIGTPTYTRDIAHAIFLYLEDPQTGIFHLANSGSASRMDMAHHINKVLGLKRKLQPISYKDLGIKTYRPPHAVLNSKYKGRYSFLRLRPWQVALEEYLLKV